VAIGTALLPTLSRQVAGRQIDDALNSQNRAIEYALLLTLPAAAALSVISLPIVHVLFERGAFDASATATTASVLAAYGIGLPAFVLIKAFAPGYFARKDTSTPVRAAMWALIANVVLNLLFMKPFGVVGIALASVVSSWLNVVLLARGLHGSGYFRPDRLLRRRVPRIVFASVIMMVLLFAFSKVLAPWLGGGLGLRVAALFVLVLLGVCSFMVVATVSGAMSWRELKAILMR
jgi:putative peptidoglycan lipid II flippase